MEQQKSMEGLQLLLVAPFLFAPTVAMASDVEDSERIRTTLGTEVAPCY